MENCLHWSAIWPSLWGIFLIVECRRTQPTVGHATPGQVVVYYIRKQGEHGPREQASEKHCSMACASAPASRFLPWVPILCSLSDDLWPGRCELSKPFISQVDIGESVLLQQLKDKLEQEVSTFLMEVIRATACSIIITPLFPIVFLKFHVHFHCVLEYLKFLNFFF